MLSCGFYFRERCITTDCKDKIRSSDWKPEWMRQERQPSFMGSQSIDPIALAQTLLSNLVSLVKFILTSF